MNDDLIRRINAEYHTSNSLRKTADEMRLSLSTVRKALITYGTYETPFSKEVLSLHSKGYGVEDIAKELNTTAKRVAAWLPYEKGMYNTVDNAAINLERCTEYKIA